MAFKCVCASHVRAFIAIDSWVMFILYRMRISGVKKHLCLKLHSVYECENNIDQTIPIPSFWKYSLFVLHNYDAINLY